MNTQHYVTYYMTDFRNPQYVERYENVTYRPEHAIVTAIPNASFQEQKHSFVVDNTNEVNPLDWFNGYLDLEFKVQKKADGTAQTGKKIAPPSGTALTFSSMKVYYGGTILFDGDDKLHFAMNVKNLIDFTKGYVTNVGPSFFMYPDVATEALKWVASAAAANTGFNARMGLVEKGERGVRGLQGIQGIQGIQGVKGSEGKPGEKGGDNFNLHTKNEFPNLKTNSFRLPSTLSVVEDEELSRHHNMPPSLIVRKSDSMIATIICDIGKLKANTIYTIRVEALSKSKPTLTGRGDVRLMVVHTLDDHFTKEEKAFNTIVRDLLVTSKTSSYVSTLLIDVLSDFEQIFPYYQTIRIDAIANVGNGVISLASEKTPNNNLGIVYKSIPTGETYKSSINIFVDKNTTIETKILVKTNVTKTAMIFYFIYGMMFNTNEKEFVPFDLGLFNDRIDLHRTKIDVKSKKITNLKNPTDAYDAATKTYVDYSMCHFIIGVKNYFSYLTSSNFTIVTGYSSDVRATTSALRYTSRFHRTTPIIERECNDRTAILLLNLDTITDSEANFLLFNLDIVSEDKSNVVTTIIQSSSNSGGIMIKKAILSNGNAFISTENIYVRRRNTTVPIKLQIITKTTRNSRLSYFVYGTTYATDQNVTIPPFYFQL